MAKPKKINILILGDGRLAPSLLLPLIERANSRSLTDYEVYSAAADPLLPDMPGVISQLGSKGSVPQITRAACLKGHLPLESRLPDIQDLLRLPETQLLVVSLLNVRDGGTAPDAHEGIHLNNWAQILATLLLVRFLSGLPAPQVLLVSGYSRIVEPDGQLLAAAQGLYDIDPFHAWIRSRQIVIPAYGQRMFRIETALGNDLQSVSKKTDNTLEFPTQDVIVCESFGKLLIQAAEMPPLLLPLASCGEELMVSPDAYGDHQRQQQLMRAVMLFADVLGFGLGIKTPARVMADPDARAFLAAVMTWECAPSFFEEKLAGLDATLTAFKRLEGQFFSGLERIIPRLAFEEWLQAVQPLYMRRMEGHKSTRMLTLLFALVFMQLIQTEDAPSGWQGMSVDMEPDQLAYAALGDQELWSGRLDEEESLFDALKEAFLDLQVIGLRSAMQRRLHERHGNP